MIANNVVEIQEQEDGVYVFPNSKRFPPTWALYVFNNGQADLYTKRAPSGALLGKPIKLGTPKDFQPCQVRLAKGSVDFSGGYRDPNPGRMCGQPATKRIDLSELVHVEKGDFYVWLCSEHDAQSKK